MKLDQLEDLKAKLQEEKEDQMKLEDTLQTTVKELGQQLSDLKVIPTVSYMSCLYYSYSLFFDDLLAVQHTSAIFGQGYIFQCLSNRV